MKQFAIFMMILGAVYAQDGAELSPVATEVLALEKARYEAMTKRNIDVLNKLLADDLTFTHANGVVESKKVFLDRLQRKDLTYHSVETSGLQIKVYDKCAIITGVSLLHVEGKGQKLTLKLRFMTVYVMKKQWRVVAYQSTRMPKK